jgi:hypothetical protein
MLVTPGLLSASDYAQLKGLQFDQKVRHMRAILAEVKATRTPQQVALLGSFTWEEAIGPFAEVIFIGQGAPGSTSRPTVVVIKRNGEVYRMLPRGLAGVMSQGPPKQVAYDLQVGQAQLMAV